MYYSLGYPPITRGWVRFSWLSESGLPEDNFGISSWGVAKLLDVTNHKAYGALKVQEKGKVLASPEATSTQEVPGKFWVLFEVMPELPIDVKTVDAVILSHCEHASEAGLQAIIAVRWIDKQRVCDERVPLKADLPLAFLLGGRILGV